MRSIQRAARLVLALGLVMPAMMAAQSAPAVSEPHESRLHRDFSTEGEALGKCRDFSFGGLTDCGQTLVMGQPMHIATGGLAPQNGTAFGLAFVEHKNFANEVRATFDVDAVASLNSSWRAGAYAKLYRQPGGFTYRAAPLLNLYSQSVSLRRVDFYGFGMNTTKATPTTFGFAENLTGASLILPTGGVWHKIGVNFVGEINGRFPSVSPGSDRKIPSIGELFDAEEVPGLARQSAYFQAAEGIRLVPQIPGQYVRIDYLVRFSQYIAPGNSQYSFRRLDFDFDHNIPLYSLLPPSLGKAYYKGRAATVQYNGPDDCSGSSGSRNINRARAGAADARPNPARPCPVIATTDKLEGSLDLRVFLSESFAGRGSQVPFYFMPTIGGGDLNGTGMVSSYPDYRFRGPNLLLFRGTFEHSLGKLPVGLLFSADAGKIAMRRGDLDISHLRHTYSAGITIHAGGLPMVSFIYAWGGSEGHHTTANLSPTLQGGSSRPGLF